MADLVYRLPVHFLVSTKVFCSSPISCEENSLAPSSILQYTATPTIKKCSFKWLILHWLRHKTSIMSHMQYVSLSEVHG